MGALLATVTVAGCGAPDRSAEATQLEATLRTVPGVTSAYVTYSNGFDSGDRVSVEVSMPGADDERVVAMVRRMNSAMGHDFDDYSRPVTISIDDGVRVSSDGPYAADSVLRDIALARAAHRDAGAGSTTLSWIDGDPVIDVDDAEDSSRATRSATAAIGNRPGQVRVLGRPHSEQVSWTVETPVSRAQVLKATSEVADLRIPARMVTVENGLVSELSLDVGVDQPTYGPIASVADRLGAERSRPLLLSWDSSALTNDGLDESGSVSVGGCDYSTTSRSEQHPENYLTADAVALQKRIRERFDTCRR